MVSLSLPLFFLILRLLLSLAFTQLGFRDNELICVSAGEILAADKPVEEFNDQVNQAEGGTLFIDEAGLFDPAPKGIMYIIFMITTYSYFMIRIKSK